MNARNPPTKCSRRGGVTSGSVSGVPGGRICGRRGTATDVYFIFLATLFIMLGFYAVIKLGPAYAMRNDAEGYGYRQAALALSYQIMDEAMLYAHHAVAQASQEAVAQYLKEGMTAADIVDGDPQTPCGTVGTYPAWSDNATTCFPVVDVLPERLRTYLTRALPTFWRHDIFRDPPHYEYRYENGKLIATAQEEFSIPILGSKDKAMGAARDVLVGERAAGTILETFSPDTTIGAQGIKVEIQPDPDRRVRSMRPTHIVLHYTGSSSLGGTVRTFLDSDLSVHYVVGMDGSVVQMVPEQEVAYHAGGCGEKLCTLENMDDRSIGIEIVNKGYLNENGKGAKQPVGTDCGQGYVYGKRFCDWPSYAAYGPEYNGKAACLSDQSKYLCWQKYPDEQLATVYALVKDIAIRNNIPVTNILSHEEIKAQKSDPGPAFPWDALRAHLGVASASPPSSTPAAPAAPPAGAPATPPATAADEAGVPLWFKPSLIWPTASKRIYSCRAPERDLLMIAANGGAVQVGADGIVYRVCTLSAGSGAGSGSGTGRGTGGSSEADCSCTSAGCACTGCDGYGNSVVVKHNDALFTRYAYLASVDSSLKEGAAIREGATVGQAQELLGLQVLTSTYDLARAGNSRNPLCYFSQATLDDLTVTPDAQYCGTYAVAGTMMLSVESGPLAEECRGVRLQDLVPQGSCGEPVGELKTEQLTKEYAWKIERTRNNIARYGLADDITNAARENGIEPSFLLGILTEESEADPFAVSNSGCAGIGQFCYNTAKEALFRQYFRPDSIKACRCHKTDNSLPYCNAKVHDSNCDTSNDDRFKPEQAIPAAARFLAKNLKDYQSYTDKYYFAAARYNSGTGQVDGTTEPGLAAGITACSAGGEPRWTCVRDYVRPQGQEYGDRVVGYMQAWGGVVPGVGSDLSCYGMTFKDLGALRFRPNAAVPMPYLATPIAELEAGMQELLVIDDNLPAIATRKLTGRRWEGTVGYCDESPFQVYFNLVLENIQECQQNNQEQCSCDPLVPPTILPDGHYMLVFHNDKTLELKTPLNYTASIATELQNLTRYGYETATAKDTIPLTRINFLFTVRDGTITERIIGLYQEYLENGQVRTRKVDPKAEIVGLYKMRKDELFGIYETPDAPLLNTVCLPTDQLLPLCVELDIPLTVDAVTIKPQIRFGLTLRDKRPAAQPGIRLTGQLASPGAQPPATLELTIAKPPATDLSGVLVYCAKGQFQTGKQYYPLRIPAPDLPETLTLDSCNGEPILPTLDDPTSVLYTVRVNSFDYGANENTVPNEASYDFTPDLQARAQAGII